MQTLREEFLAGEQPKTCRRCWAEERSGRTSKRMHTLDRLKHMIDDSEWTTDAKPLMFLDLKLGNICNLKCRICGSWSSSQFATEELQALSDPAEKRSSFHYTMLKDGAWPRTSELFWQELDTVISEVRYIEFTGGEPFMIKEHFDLLRKLVERGHSDQIEIHYNTNGTQYPEEAEAVWSHFKHVEIAFSIDDVGSRFEYQRTNAQWSEVCTNIERFKDLRSRHSNITLQVCCTVSVFNVMYLEHVAAWIAAQGFDYVYWNMLHDAYYFSIGTMPAIVKTRVTEHLSAVEIPVIFQKEFENIQSFMHNGASLDGSILRMKIEDLDFKRNEQLRDVAPELYRAIYE
jgi:pyruvate-formate lyase-activating enzyme